MIKVNWSGKDEYITEKDYATWMDEENLRQQHMWAQASCDEEGCNE